MLLYIRSQSAASDRRIEALMMWWILGAVALVLTGAALALIHFGSPQRRLVRAARRYHEMVNTLGLSVQHGQLPGYSISHYVRLDRGRADKRHPLICRLEVVMTDRRFRELTRVDFSVFADRPAVYRSQVTSGFMPDGGEFTRTIGIEPNTGGRDRRLNGSQMLRLSRHFDIETARVRLARTTV